MKIEAYYFLCRIYCGNISNSSDIVHTEIVKVLPPVGERIMDGKWPRCTGEIRIEINRSMEPISKRPSIYKDQIKPIRARVKEAGGGWKKSVLPLVSDDIEEQYNHHMKTRDKTLGYFFDEPYLSITSRKGHTHSMILLNERCKAIETKAAATK